VKSPSVEDNVELIAVENSGALTTSSERKQRREFEALVRRYHGQAFNVAYRMTGNRTDAEDLLQETFLRAFRFFSNYRRDLPFESWLYKIMSNLWIDTLRRPDAGPPGRGANSGGEPDRRDSGLPHSGGVECPEKGVPNGGDPRGY